VSLRDLCRASGLVGRLPELAGRSVLLVTHDPLAAAVALIELDGVARRIVICPPDLSEENVPSVIASAETNAVVFDGPEPFESARDVALQVRCGATLGTGPASMSAACSTEWVMLTSGTTGRPKLFAHTLEGLTGAIKGQHAGADVVWGTFYDIRRYGGLQIFLRAVLGNGSFVISSPGESAAEYLGRLAAHGVTHLSGTPSHWRRALMSPAARAITPRYVRLSGEIADQAILNALRSFYPQASIGHAYASTEAGVGFEVSDGLEGFPAAQLASMADVEMKVEDGSLRIRSKRTATGRLGEEGEPLADAEGFVDTGDMVELRGDRYYFLGRRSGMINIGGLKVYPEEVETAINRHAAVRMSVVRAVKNPITGSLVAADVVLKAEAGDATLNRTADIRREILTICHDMLPAHKVPAIIRFVPSLQVASAGKLVRH
jgi:acyl-coenzyme A synthetase/AMP-(fatty) acid ligase